jgi:hypothetical protein
MFSFRLKDATAKLKQKVCKINEKFYFLKDKRKAEENIHGTSNGNLFSLSLKRENKINTEDFKGSWSQLQFRKEKLLAAS